MNRAQMKRAAMAPHYIVELEPGVYTAPWAGDPGRTCVLATSVRYKNISLATYALARARRWRQFRDAKIIEEHLPDFEVRR